MSELQDTDGVKSKKFKGFRLFAPKKVFLKEAMQGAKNLKKKERENFRRTAINDSETHSTFVLTNDGTMFVSAYILNDEIFDNESAYYVPIGEYCQTFVKENPVDNYAVFIFKRLGAVIVTNQGMVANYIAGITDFKKLVTTAKELIKAIEVKGYKDTKVFTDEFLDPFSSELVDFNKLNLYSKIDDSQKIKNKKVSLMTRLFSSKPKEKKEVVEDETPTVKAKSSGLTTFLLLSVLAGQSAGAYFLYEGHVAQKESELKMVSQEAQTQVLLSKVEEASANVTALSGEMKRMERLRAMTASQGMGGGDQGMSDISMQLLELRELMSNSINNSGVVYSGTAGNGGQGKAEEVAGAKEALDEAIKELEGFSCKVTMQSRRYLTCIHDGKSVRVGVNDEARLSNGMKMKYLPDSDSVKLSKGSVQRIFPVSQINR